MSPGLSEAVWMNGGKPGEKLPYARKKRMRGCFPAGSPRNAARLFCRTQTCLRPDFAEFRLAVEVDGKHFHETVSDTHRDDDLPLHTGSATAGKRTADFKCHRPPPPPTRGASRSGARRCVSGGEQFHS